MDKDKKSAILARELAWGMWICAAGAWVGIPFMKYGYRSGLSYGAWQWGIEIGAWMGAGSVALAAAVVFYGWRVCVARPWSLVIALANIPVSLYLAMMGLMTHIGHI